MTTIITIKSKIKKNKLIFADYYMFNKINKKPQIITACKPEKISVLINLFNRDSNIHKFIHYPNIILFFFSHFAN